VRVLLHPSRNVHMYTHFHGGMPSE
jgi:hypothetical protein